MQKKKKTVNNNTQLETFQVFKNIADIDVMMFLPMTDLNDG